MVRTRSETAILAAAENWARLLERAVAVEAGTLDDDDAHDDLYAAIYTLYGAVRDRLAGDSPGCGAGRSAPHQA